MSWQRVLKTAQRLGAPVIVTDQAGNDPLIILPLDVYDDLAGQAKDADRGRKPTRRSVEPDERVESVFEMPFEDELPIMISKIWLKLAKKSRLNLWKSWRAKKAKTKEFR